MRPPAFLLFFPWYASPRWREAEFCDPFDWVPVGTTLDAHPSVEFYRKQFEYIRGIGIDCLAWEYSYIEPGDGPRYTCPHPNAVEALVATGLPIAPHFDLELSFQVFEQIEHYVPELNVAGSIRPDLDTVHFIDDGLRTFYEQIPPELVARDGNGDAVIFVYGFGFDGDADPEKWSRFADVLSLCAAAHVGPKFKFYWSCTNRPGQEHLFLHHRRHFTPYQFVLDTPQSQFSHDSVTWNFGFDNLYVLRHYGSMRVVRADPRYVEEPAWLAHAADPALIFIYGWNEPFEGSFLFPSVRWGETKAQLVAHYLRLLENSTVERLPRLLLIVDDISEAIRARQGDWHIALLRDMLLYRLRLLAPQADVALPAGVDAELLDRYDAIVDLTSEKDQRVVELVRACWNRMPVMVFDPMAATREIGYADRFFRHTEYRDVNAALPIRGSGEQVFVRDDVAAGPVHEGCTVHLWAEEHDGGALPLVVTCDRAIFVNSYGNSELVMSVAFELLYGRPIGTSVLYGEGHASQRLEQTADGTVTYNRCVRRSVNARLPVPEWVRWNRMPPEVDESHAPFLFGLEAEGDNAAAK